MYAGGGSSLPSGAASHGHHAHAGGSSGSGGASSHGHHSSAAFSSQQAEANDLDALVFDFGSSKCKLGFAGEDFPRVYESPLALEGQEDHQAQGFDAESELMNARARRAARMELEPEKVAQWLFDAAASRLRTRVGDHPLLVAERPFAFPAEVVNFREDGEAAGQEAANRKRDARHRERMVEVLMEDLGVPAVFFAKSPVLVCYANARTSGLVVELGATYSSVSTVHDGYALSYPRSQVALFGGHDLDAFLRAKVAPQLVKSHAVMSADELIARRGSADASAWSYAVEAKESGLCRAADGAFDEAQNTQLPLINYELPDKTVVTLGTERFSVAEQYFISATRPDANAESSTETAAPATSSNPILASNGSHIAAINLPDIICETAGRSTETELRRELLQNVVVSGGSSCFENLPTRLEREIVNSLINQPLTSAAGPYAAAANMRVKVVAAHTQERKVGAFLGGSILASLGSFHEMWLSKHEYAEHGASLVHKKCP